MFHIQILTVQWACISDVGSMAGGRGFQLDVHLIPSMHLQYIYSIQFSNFFHYQCCVSSTGNMFINKTSLRQFQRHATFGLSSVAPCITMSNFDIAFTLWTPRGQDNTLLSSTFSFTCLNLSRSLGKCIQWLTVWMTQQVPLNPKSHEINSASCDESLARRTGWLAVDLAR